MKKCVFLFVISLLCLSCNNQQQSDVTQKQSQTQKEQKNFSVLNKVELSSIKTGFSDNRATVFYPVISMKVKNISNNDISHDILVEAIFINKSKEEQLEKELELILGPLYSGMSKTITLKCPDGLTFLGKGVIEALKNANIACRIYINKEFYKEVDIEAKPFM